MHQWLTSERGYSLASRSSTSVWETVRPCSSAASEAGTLIPGMFLLAETTAHSISSPLRGSRPELAGYSTPSHSPSTCGVRLEGESDSSLVFTSPAPAISITSIAGALPGIKTEVAWFLTSAEATYITRIGRYDVYFAPDLLSFVCSHLL